MALVLLVVIAGVLGAMVMPGRGGRSRGGTGAGWDGGGC
jgi:hypothetical protein